MTHHARLGDSDGSAALGICESILLAMTDLKLISEKEATNILTDVANAHAVAASASPTPEKHETVVKTIEQMLSGRNGVRQ